jgi:Protein kinase domain
MENPDLQELNARLDRKVQQLEALIEFGRVLAGILDPADVARRLGLTLAGQWAVRAYGIVVFRDGREPLIRHRGMPALESVADVSGEIASWREPFRSSAPPKETLPELAELLNAVRAEVVVPLVSGETPIGFAALGARAGGVAYDDDDLAHAFGLARQAVVAFEGTWQSQEASRWRLISEAGAEWRELDRLSRLLFVAVARFGYEKPQQEGDFTAEVVETFNQPPLSLTPERVAAGLERLIDRGAISRSADGTLHVEKQTWLALPEARRPLAEIARQLVERIGAYEIVERIGGGGMGEVYRAVNVHDGSLAAVKLLATGDTHNNETRRRLEREGAIVASISHPNIVRLLARGEHEGRLFLAMELLDGQPLSAALRLGPLTLSRAFSGALDLASAIAELHARGVVHRDIKSSNVMQTASGRLVLLDFGLARALDSTTVTRQSEVMGTLPYMPPEQLRGEPVDSRADVWAFGIVLYEMVLGIRPWKANDTVRLAVEILSARPRVPDEWRPAVGAPLTELLHDALNPVLSERIRDGGELLDRLKAISTCYADADRLVSAAFAVDSDAQTEVDKSFGTRRTP